MACETFLKLSTYLVKFSSWCLDRGDRILGSCAFVAANTSAQPSYALGALFCSGRPGWLPCLVVS